MNQTSNASRPALGRFGRDSFATVWPATVPQDSELQRRKKLAVRAAQLAVAIMVTAAMTGAIAADAAVLSGLQITGMIFVGLAYILWCWHGIREPVRRVLWESSPSAPSAGTTPLGWKLIAFFAVQLALAGVLFALGIRDAAGDWCAADLEMFERERTSYEWNSHLSGPPTIVPRTDRQSGWPWSKSFLEAGSTHRSSETPSPIMSQARNNWGRTRFTSTDAWRRAAWNGNDDHERKESA